MKTYIGILLVFSTFNCFSQDSVRFEENGKYGLKGRDGKMILEAKYTDLTIEATGIRLYNNELQGYLPKGSQKIIPPNYTAVTKIGSYFEGRTENGTMDLYFGSEIIASDLDPGLEETDLLVEAGLIIIRKEEKAGIINSKGEIVVPFEYPVIERIQSFEYELVDHTRMNYMLVLDKSEYFYSPESGGFLRFGEPVLYLAKGDGTLVTDSAFSDISFDTESNRFSLSSNKKNAVLDKEFQMNYPDESTTD